MAGSSRNFTITLTLKGQDRGASSMLGRVSGFLGGLATVAGGIISAGALIGIARQIGSIGKSAIMEAGNLQNFRVALETLTARELVRGSAVEEAHHTIREATLDELALRDKLTEQIANQDTTVRQLTKTQGGSAVATRLAVRQLDRLNLQVKALGINSEGLVNVTTTSTKTTLGFADALEEAKFKANGTFDALRDLSLISPFEFGTIAQVFKLQLAFGSTTETALDLTRALTNTSAGLGLTNEQSQRLALNWGQVVSQGKIMGMDLRQLRLVGVDLADVFQNQLGMSLQEVNDALDNGTLSTEELSSAFVRFADENFGGAAERMSKTLLGLGSSFKDLFTFASADLLTPAIEFVTGKLSQLFDKARRAIEDGTLENIGLSIVEGLEKAERKLNQIPLLLSMLKGGTAGQLAVAGDILAGWGLSEGTITVITGFFGWIANDWPGIRDRIGEVADAVNDKLVAALSALSDWWSEFGADVITFFIGFATVLAINALLVSVASGIAGLVAAFAGLVALVTPLFVLAVAVGVLFMFIRKFGPQVWITILQLNVILRAGLANLVLLFRAAALKVSFTLMNWANNINAFRDKIRATMLQIAAIFWGSILIISNAINEAKTKIGITLTQIGIIAKIKLRAVALKVKAGFQGVVDKVSGFITKAKEIGKNLILGFVDGILGTVGALITAIKGAIAAAIEAAKQALGESSPSKVFMDIGGNVTKGFAIGIDEGAALPVRAIADAANNVAGAGQVAPVGVGGGGDTFSFTLNFPDTTLTEENAEEIFSGIIEKYRRR